MEITIQTAYYRVLANDEISKAKGSFHGKGLNERKKEKRTLESARLYLEQLLQPQLTYFDEVIVNTHLKHDRPMAVFY